MLGNLLLRQRQVSCSSLKCAFVPSFLQSVQDTLVHRHFALEEHPEGVLRHSRLDPDSFSKHPEEADRLGCFRNYGRKLETTVNGGTGKKSSPSSMTNWRRRSGQNEETGHTRWRWCIAVHRIAFLLPVHRVGHVSVLIHRIILHPLSARDEPL